MIQRVQSLYFLIASILLGASTFLPVGYMSGDRLIDVDTFKPWGVYFSDGSFHSTWALFLILLSATILELAAIVSFMNRMRQIRIAVFSCILVLGFYACLAYFAYVITGSLENETFRPSWLLTLPFASLVMNYLAIRAVYSDEFMVRASRKLR